MLGTKSKGARFFGYALFTLVGPRGFEPGCLDRVHEWANEITRRKQEALETLRNETVLLENFFLKQAEDGDYLIGVMTAESFERSQAAVRESEHDIDTYHQQFKRDTWESGKPLELLVELNRLREPLQGSSKREEECGLDL